jgi:gliding motility-associated-like protein
LFSIRLAAQHFICRDTFISIVNVYDQPPAPSRHWDTTIVAGQTSPLNAFAGAGYTYTWTPLVDYLNCVTCITPISNTFSDITYSVLAEDELHCNVSESTYRVMVEYKASLDVPGAFTPNGDGVNDVIYVDGWGLKKLIYFRVFNRWGQLLFESNDLDTGWDGQFSGIPQNMETYIYQASMETYVKEQPVLKKDGTFKIIR